MRVAIGIARETTIRFARTALSYIARVTQVEKELRKAYPAENLQGKRDFAAVAAGRQRHALPILAEFKAWLDEESESQKDLTKESDPCGIHVHTESVGYVGSLHGRGLLVVR